MSEIPLKTKKQKITVTCPSSIHPRTKVSNNDSFEAGIGTSVDKLYRSQGNQRNPNTGNYESGGEFYTTHEGPIYGAGHATKIVGGNNLDQMYTGPIFAPHVGAAIGSNHITLAPDSMDESSMNADGATAISIVSPTNPTANVGTTLAETYREGVPSLPGIQSWKNRTQKLVALGSEYLNYQFGWAPLVSEVHDTVDTVRHHRDVLQNYRRGEGVNFKRRFDFDDETSSWEEEIPPANSNFGLVNGSSWYAPFSPEAQRVVRVEHIRKRWFEGCFTYGGPGKTDSFSSAIHFGREADKLYGTTLTPKVLWELTPWSWAIDWFTNAGDVINNISNFASAGLVMRYGYMMEEFHSIYKTEYGDFPFRVEPKPFQYQTVRAGACSHGVITTTKARLPANPFGFGVGWEGLSPTQLAITAAIGITRLLK